MKKWFLFITTVLLLFQASSASYARNSWELQNGDPQLSNFNNTTVSKDLFLKHELSLDTLSKPYSMVINGDILYSLASKNTKLYAVSLDTKAIRWEFTPPDTNDIKRIALVNGNVAVLTASHMYLLKDEQTTKSILWEKPVGGYLLSFGEQSLYVSNGSKVTSLSISTGETNWTYSINTAGGETFNSPIVVGTDKVYFTTDNQKQMERKLYAINLTGQVLWTTNVDYYSMYPLLRGNIIFTSSLTEVYAYDATTGRYLWKKTLDSAYMPQRENIFSANEDTLFTRTTKGELWAFENKNGNQKFKVSFEEPQLSRYSTGPILVTNDEVILEIAGKIKFFNSTTGEMTRALAIPNVSLNPVAVTDKYVVAASDTKVYVYGTANDPQYQDPSGTEEPTPTPVPSPPQGEEKIHVVQPGDTLWKIANHYSVEIKAIIDRNNLDPNTYLWVGQNLIIPKPQTIYTVQAGDTLWKIANQFHTTIKAIMDKNKLDANSYIWIGQKLIIPEDLLIHTVATGETLWLISKKYNTTIQAIVTENQIDPNGYIWVGQRLVIPK